MGKPNTYVQLLAAKKEIAQLRYEMDFMKGFTIQQCMDMAMIVLHERFGFGPDRCKAFGRAFQDTFIEYARMCVADGADDPEIVYTEEKVDRALRAAYGEDLLPFRERYAEERLYFRDRLGEAVQAGAEKA